MIPMISSILGSRFVQTKFNVNYNSRSNVLFQEDQFCRKEMREQQQLSKKTVFGEPSPRHTLSNSLAGLVRAPKKVSCIDRAHLQLDASNQNNKNSPNCDSYGLAHMYNIGCTICICDWNYWCTCGELESEGDRLGNLVLQELASRRCYMSQD